MFKEYAKIYTHSNNIFIHKHMYNNIIYIIILIYIIIHMCIFPLIHSENMNF